ncbi:hypothetical protein JHK87_052558 [Glycine soja]|nr:hypothetical protein JHK87_052558 [Glycine soja]
MAQARDASSPITTSCNREDLDDDGDDDETDDIHGDDPIRGLNHDKNTGCNKLVVEPEVAVINTCNLLKLVELGGLLRTRRNLDG